MNKNLFVCLAMLSSLSAVSFDARAETLGVGNVRSSKFVCRGGQPVLLCLYPKPGDGTGGAGSVRRRTIDASAAGSNGQHGDADQLGYITVLLAKIEKALSGLWR